MKKSSLASAVMALAAVTTSHAQQSVSVYGLLDTGVEYLNNVGAGGGTLTRMPGQTGTVPSRLGFRGSEDLGGGLSAVFTLEQGLLPDTGTQGQGGRAFGRQAFVGVSGSFGTVSLGRQYTMLFWSLLDADILGPNIYGASSLDSYIPNARADNAIAWRGKFGGFSVGATYSLGRDAVNAGPTPAGTNCAGENPADTRACGEWSAMVKYDGDGWGSALAVDQIRGGAGAFGGLTQSALRDRRVSANGYAKWGSTKVGAGLIRRDNDGSLTTPRSDLWYLGVAQPLTEVLTLDAEVYRLSYQNSSNSSTLLSARLTYALSKRTAVYGTMGRINNNGTSAVSVSGGAPGSNPAAGVGQTGAMLGIRHSF